MMYLFQAILLLHTIYIIENLEDMIMTRQEAEQLKSLDELMFTIVKFSFYIAFVSLAILINRPAHTYHFSDELAG